MVRRPLLSTRREARTATPPPIAPADESVTVVLITSMEADGDLRMVGEKKLPPPQKKTIATGEPQGVAGEHRADRWGLRGGGVPGVDENAAAADRGRAVAHHQAIRGKGVALGLDVHAA